MKPLLTKAGVFNLQHPTFVEAWSRTSRMDLKPEVAIREAGIRAAIRAAGANGHALSACERSLECCFCDVSGYIVDAKDHDPAGKTTAPKLAGPLAEALRSDAPCKGRR
jgi:hypothetical protein